MRPRRWRYRVGLTAVAVASLASSAYAGAQVIPSQPLSGRVPGVVTPTSPRSPQSYAGRAYRVVIEPSLDAGQAGWTSSLAYRIHAQLEGGGGGGGYPTKQSPFFGGGGFSGYAAGHAPPGDVVDYFLTGPGVAAIRVGKEIIETRTGSNIPAGDRAVVFFEPASAPAVVTRGPFPFPWIRALPLDAGGHLIRTGPAAEFPERETFWQAPSAGYSSQPPFTGPDHPLPGACELSEHGLPALTPEFGHVIGRIRAVSRAQGEVFLSCIDTTYYLHGWPLVAAVLVDAKHPGRAPGSIPGAHPVRGHLGTVNLPAGSFPGALTGRRVGQAWLVVQGGASLRQRLRVLEALRIQRLALPRR
jgi:hypothetical protein